MSISPVHLTVKRLTRLSSGSSVKAFSDVAVSESILIKGLKVVEGKNGLFVSMPRELGKNGQWYDTVVPLSKEAKAKLSQIVLEAYSNPDVLLS
ncbi:MAG: septation protein SpoVG family protein [Candidatus Omnitrophica bacterium]|nr:septation protein SpoVG family protein [Candidatus Omnitrophota bacterium]